MTVPNVAGSFCSPKCSSSNPPTCPSDAPAGSTATPQCAINAQSKGYRCALICTPSSNDAQCGPDASCKSAKGENTGVCTYDD
jgi:hypothetical protein